MPKVKSNQPRVRISIATPKDIEGQANLPRILWAPQPGPQTEAMMREEFEIFVGGAKFGGKFQGLSSIIYTPFGPKRMGDIHIGDHVSNPSGSVSTVIAIHPQGEKELYRIKFSDGAETLAGGDHLWLARPTARILKADRRYYPFRDEDRVYGKLYTTNQLRTHLDKWSGRERDQWCNGAPAIRIPLSAPVEFTIPDNGTRMQFDPYVLGVLLGDGCLRQKTVKITSADQEIIRTVAERTGIELRPNSKLKSKSADWRMLAAGRIIESLRSIGIYDKLAPDKFVPCHYLTASIAMRRELIQGLMDTDGYVDDRGHCSYTSVSNELAKNVQFIARSLGYKASITQDEAGYRNAEGEFIECHDAYTVWITGEHTDELFKLARKRARCIEPNKGKIAGIGASASRRIVSIESVGKEECQCISIDNPNGLYVTDDFIVTHNSYLGIGWLISGNPHVPRDKATSIDMSYLYCPNYRALALRHNLIDLRSWIDEAYAIYKPMGADFRQNPDEFVFPSGAKIILGHLDTSDAVYKYFGQVVHRVFLDELTFIPTFKTYQLLMSCVRSTIPGIRPQMLLTGNPGGPGHSWVKSRFITPVDESTGMIIQPHTTISEKKSYNPFLKSYQSITRVFIPAKIADNKIGIANDPTYYDRLVTMDEAERKAYLHGDWGAFEGEFFKSFRAVRRDYEPENACHVVSLKNRNLEPWWPRWIGGDWGFKHASAIFWACQDPNGQVIIYRELIAPEVSAVELGMAIAAASMNDINGLERKSMLMHYSPDAWAQRDEPNTIAELVMGGMARVLGRNAVFELDSDMSVSGPTHGSASIGIMKAPSARILGWQYVRELMRWDVPKLPGLVERKKEVTPKLLISDQCPQLIRAIPTAAYKEGTEDLLKTESVDDDILDGLRYTLAPHKYMQNVEPYEVFHARRMEEVMIRHPEGIEGITQFFVNQKIQQDYEGKKFDKEMSLPRSSSRRGKMFDRQAWARERGLPLQ